jgi:hypothetical protein
VRVPRWQLRYAIACTAIAGWSIAYALASWGQWPRLIYDPLAHSWALRSRPGGPIPIDYWGLIAWGAGGLILGALIALLFSRLYRRPLPRLALGLLGAWALTAFLYAGTYFTWTLWPF